METPTVWTRVQKFTRSSMRTPNYMHKMWLAALCIIAFGGDFGTCFRSLNEAVSRNSFSKGAKDAADRWLTPTSADLQFANNDNTHDPLHTRSKLFGKSPCDSKNLKITSDVTRYLGTGIPMYRIEIANTCTECSLADIHVACGAWASQTLVNPNLFRRITEDDCVVNNGNALDSDEIFFFEYSNSFPYPMCVKNANPVCK